MQRLRKSTFQRESGTSAESLCLRAGVNIVFDSRLFSGVRSQGIQGSYETHDGFTELLKNTNYQIKQTSSGYRVEEKIKIIKKKKWLN
jgi:iron complex outermembrane receptor protein